MDVEFTKHAEDMLKERKFDRAFIVDVVCNPERKERVQVTCGMLFEELAIKW